MLAQLVKEGLNRPHSAIQDEKYLILKNVRMCGNSVNIIRFSCGQYVPEVLSAGKRSYIKIGREYLLSVRVFKETLELSTASLYEMASGRPCVANLRGLDNCYAGCLVVLDGKILAVCDKSFPRFFAVVGNTMRELPAASVLNVLLQKPYTEAQLESLNRFFPEAGWEFHNGILINPDTLDAPCPLHLRVWHDKRKAIKAKMRNPLDIGLLLSALPRSSSCRPWITNIKSEQF